jgi:alanine dehydrogenase
MGLKIVTVTPGNRQRNLPTIQGTYLLLDMVTGSGIAQLDAPALTYLRTAGTSAVASGFLSRKTSSKLLMVGTGSLIPYLVAAHMSVRPIKEVLIWGRNHEKARDLAHHLKELPADIYPVQDLNSAVSNADIISTATMSDQPLIKGSSLVPGQHLDLVGSYRPDMREADDDAIGISSVYIDSRQAVLESGELKQSIDAGIINEESIEGDIFQLCRRVSAGRKDNYQITAFKSVGHASQDLIIAVLAYRKISGEFKRENGNK